MSGIYNYRNHFHPHGTNDTMPSITQSMAKKDTAVPKPSRRDPASLVTLLANLEVGKCHVVAIEVTGTDWNQTQAMAGSAADALKGTLAPTIQRAKNDTGFQYARETFTCMSPSMRVYVQTVITRIA